MQSSFPIEAAMLGALLAVALALSALGPAGAQEYKVLATNLYGEGSVGGGASEEGTGDFDGEIDFARVRLCYYLEYFDIDSPTEAHIHRGEEDDESGPVVLNLPLPDEPGDEACVEAPVEVLIAIAEQPAGHYVDVHTAEYPEGAIRGQLRE